MRCLFLTSILLSVIGALPTQSLSQSTSQSVPSVAEVQAKQELDEAARAYREGNFAEAQLHSERALQLDPANKLAPYFIARTIHAQYKPGDVTPENQAKAREAIVAYQQILLRSPNDEEAYKAIAYIYGSLKEEELLRDWVLKRAADTSIDKDKRAEAYVVLASKDWDCSFKITELPGNKVTTVEPGEKALVSYRKPKNQTDFEQARQCASRGLDMSEMAITLMPENEAAWSYKTNIFLELSKLAEMSGDLEQKSKLQRQYDEALAETMRLSRAAQEKARKPEK